jgi:hypothetical protein
MIAYTDIHLDDLRNLSFKSFTEILLNDFYPFVYSELKKLDEQMHVLKFDYDVDVLDATIKKIYYEFDAMHRKEKLVLFPFILQLEEDNKKSENCSPFKNTKAHFTTIVSLIVNATKTIEDIFVNNMNQHALDEMNSTLSDLKDSMIDLQSIKDKEFYRHYKSCTGCSSIDK